MLVMELFVILFNGIYDIVLLVSRYVYLFRDHLPMLVIELFVILFNGIYDIVLFLYSGLKRVHGYNLCFLLHNT